jgi:hypothetical protein
MRPSRRFLAAALLTALLQVPAPATADVGPPIRVRWSGEWPAPARPGVETVGRFEIAVERDAVVEDLEVAGEGWTLRGLDSGRRLDLAKGARRVITFRAVPTDPSAPLVITGRVNGMPFRKAFRLDAERLSRIGRPGAVRMAAAPVLGATEPGTTIQNARNIRFRGRFMYDRGSDLVGGDNVVVRIMDDDAPFSDEEIGRFLTDSEGNFDQTIWWDDCDITGCDQPDIYVIYEMANLVVEVRTDDTEEMYTWSTEDQEITDYAGTDVDFGIHTPNGGDQAVHIYNGIVRAHRYAQIHGQMNGAHTFCHWPADSGAFYSDDFNQIHIGSDEEWNEGTIVHEYGHRLAEQFSVLDTPNYNNGFCDVPTPGHCVWCPENLKDAWQEGFANWFGSVVLRDWAGSYDDTPLSMNDNRYMLETSSACSPGQFFANASTEGYVGMLLRDIEDATNEDDDTDPGVPDCAMDMLNLGSPPILRVFRDNDPATVNDFLTAFRTLYAERDYDLWPTIENVAPAMNFPQPTPVISANAPSCRIVRAGETVQISVTSRGTLDRYQWRRNGVPLVNNDGRVTGIFTRTLQITEFNASYQGNYDCVVSSCDGTLSVTSVATQLRLGHPTTPAQVISLGENGSAQAGNGTTTYSVPPHLHNGLNNIIATDGGRLFTIMLRQDGTVLTCGFEGYGELGDGGSGYSTVTAPTPIALNDIVRIAAGKSSAFALRRDGTIASWGWNFYGQLFTGDQIHRSEPGNALFFGCVKDIAAGDDHALALLEDGTVWAVGYNAYGTMGNGSYVTPVTTPTQVPGLTNVIDIEAAGNWCMVLRADSTVWTWGINTWGQLGLGHYNTVPVPTQVPGVTGIKQISAGVDNGYALKADGTAWAWGYGPALGIGWTGGSSNVPQPVPLANITEIEGGSGWAMAVVNGRLKGWGLNHSVYPPMPGVFNNTGPYVQPSPVDVTGVSAVTGIDTGWGTAHAYGVLGNVDVPVADGNPAPTRLALAAAPNPARASSTIRFDLPTSGPVRLAVYDLSGRLVKSLAKESFEAGRYARTWDGVTESGARTAAGVYFVRLSAPGGMLTRTILRVN